jgi:SAM-dependent methyltransferase
MRLSWRAQQPRAEDDEEQGPDGDGLQVETHQSPGLKGVFLSVPTDGSCRILDLGCVVAGNLDFFSSFASRLQIVDLLGCGRAGGKADRQTPPARLQAVRGLLADHERSFHAVFAWDVFNYLPFDECKALAAEVARLCRPGGRLLAMVAASNTIPATPNRYRIVDGETIDYEPTTTEVKGGPQLTPAAVERLLEGFSIEHSFVLRHGVREYVAVRG